MTGPTHQKHEVPISLAVPKLYEAVSHLKARCEGGMQAAPRGCMGVAALNLSCCGSEKVQKPGASQTHLPRPQSALQICENLIEPGHALKACLPFLVFLARRWAN